LPVLANQGIKGGDNSKTNKKVSLFVLRSSKGDRTGVLSCRGKSENQINENQGADFQSMKKTFEAIVSHLKFVIKLADTIS
jgi:hypothetical protein